MGLMNTIRRAFGFDAPHEPNDEQRRVELRLARIEQRLKLREQSLDIQAEVLAADRRDARSHR